MAKQKKGFAEFIEGAPLLTAPKGSVLWAKVHKPDTQFKEDGQFSISLTYKKGHTALKKLRKKLKPIHDAWVAECKERLSRNTIKGAAVPGGKVVTDKEGDPTDQVELRFSKNAWLTKDDPASPIRVFDSKGKPVTCEIGNGSIGMVGFRVRGYWSPQLGAGLSLHPEGVKIIELVEFVRHVDPEFSEMFEEEDGFSAEDDDDTGGMFDGDGDDDDDDSDSDSDDDDDDEF